MGQSPQADAAAADSTIVAKAMLRAAERLDLSDKVLGRMIGVSGATLSRLRRGEYSLEKNQKPFELAVMFVRLYRSLDAMVGGDDKVAQAWLRNQNSALEAVPIEVIQTISGLAHVIQYLDSRRAVV
jgi:hypothetical protein